MHALRLPSFATPYVPIPPEIDLELERKALDRLAEIERRLGAAGFKVRTEIRHDEPASALRDAALEGKADLVVIGTRGLSRLEHLLLGSVAERVIVDRSGAGAAGSSRGLRSPPAAAPGAGPDRLLGGGAAIGARSRSSSSARAARAS